MAMTSTLQIPVLLLAVIAAVAVVAKRLQTPPSILLVLTGVILAVALHVKPDKMPELKGETFTA
jgi:Kef-type K+ transport system membrane component KefB